MKSCFNPFVYSFITCNGSHITLVSANLRWISLPHYGIFKIALIGLIELLKLQPFSILSVWQTSAATCSACEFPLHLHSKGSVIFSTVHGKQMLYPAESQVIDGITNQRVNLTLGNHNMYILFFSAGNREQRKLFFKLGHFFFFQKHKNKETVLPFPKYRVRDTTNCKLDLWGIKNYLHYS